MTTGHYLPHLQQAPAATDNGGNPGVTPRPRGAGAWQSNGFSLETREITGLREMVALENPLDSMQTGPLEELLKSPVIM